MQTRHPQDLGFSKKAESLLGKALYDGKTDLFRMLIETSSCEKLWLTRQPLQKFLLLRSDGTWQKNHIHKTIETKKYCCKELEEPSWI